MEQNKKNILDGRTVDCNQLPSEQEPKSKRKRLLWTALFIALAVLSIWAVSAQVKDFSLRDLADALARADFRWLFVAVIAMLGFIVFEACALRCACNALRYPTSFRSDCIYAASDIYFSAITPSATGGQPACAFLMMRDGIPGTVTTEVLLLTLVMYSLAILVIGFLCFVLSPDVFLRFGTPSKILILTGYVVQLALSLFFFLLLKSENLLERICRGVLHFFGKLHLLRNEGKKQEKLSAVMKEYRQCAALLSGHRALLLRSFFFNFFQRASQISVTMLVYLAMGGNAAHAADIWAMQSYAVIGSNCVPIPGAMGISDYLMLDGFRAFLPPQTAVVMELLSRSLSFYCCIFLCGVIVLFFFRHRNRKGEKK